MIIPYFATLGWMREWFAGNIEPLPNRALTRVLLTPDLTLSVPVQGGASALKRLPFDELIVSSHGRWNTVHERALEAAYSKTPFFKHLWHTIQPVLQNPPLRVAELNSAVHDALTGVINLDELDCEFRNALAENPARFRKICDDLAVEGGDDLPFFAHVCRLGPDAIFMLADTLLP